MIAQRLPGGRAEGAALALGTVALVSGAAYLTLRTGAPQTLGPVVAVLAALGVTAGFARAPHVMIAATIPFMVALPTVTSLWVPWLGPSKDALVLAAVAGVAWWGWRYCWCSSGGSGCWRGTGAGRACWREAS